MLLATPVIFFKVKDSTDVEEDLKFSDETAADVLGETEGGINLPEKPRAHEDASDKA
jgi:hypothetical protein